MDRQVSGITSALNKLFAALLLLLAGPAPAAAGWRFDPPVAVSGDPEPSVFHHLDSAGRKNIAVSGNRVAVVWEDNRDGTPRIYLATKKIDAGDFDKASLVSGSGNAYEPAIAGTGNGRFSIVWEEDNAVFTRMLGNGHLGPRLKLSTDAAGHASIAGMDGRAYAVWREKRGSYPALYFSRLTLADASNSMAGKPLPLEPAAPAAPQLYPAIAAGSAGIAIAWEDRRAGHTRLLFSHSVDGLQFSPPEELNEFFSNRNAYDKGNGVTRVALAAFGADEVLAAWMDKRRGKKGYAIYAAMGSEGGESYGPNERVQGNDGDELPHYNPAVAGNADGAFIVAWDDYRSGTSDIWLSQYTDDLEWGEDFSPPGASGPGEQSNPSVTIDEHGRLHLVWTERSAIGKPTRIWYMAAVYSESD